MTKTLFLFILSFSATFAQIDSILYFAYQIQGLDAPGAIDSLANSYYDLLVLEPTRTDVDCIDFDARGMVEQLHATSGTVLSTKLVIAYIDIGEAEDWRVYWQSWWEAPTDSTFGNPDFILRLDPDGWEGDYPVAFWDSRWQDIIVDNDSSMLKMAIADGFDGIYMDWVEAYDDSMVIAVAETAGISPDSAMVAFIQHIRNVARSINPNFLIIAQNAPDLCDDHPEYFGIIDAIGQEDFNFYGEADVDWGNPLAGDIPQDTDYHDYLMGQLDTYLANDVPVLTIEYALIPSNIDFAYTYDYARGYIPFVTQTPLSRLPDYYPPGYAIHTKSSVKPEFAITATPNPFNSSCSIVAPAGAENLSRLVGIEIYGLRGNVVWRTNPSDNKERIQRTAKREWSSGTLVWQPDESIPSGIYFIHATTQDGRTATKRIVYIE